MKSIRCFTRTALVALPLLALSLAPVAHAGYDEMTAGTASQQMMSQDATRARNAQMLIQTLSEELTEINSLAAQQAMFRRMGDAESTRIARLWGVWIREHKAGGPMLMKLIRQNGGDPSQARILKAPPLGTKMEMLHATHMDHMNAVMTSQMRHRMTNSGKIKMAMRKRANLARKHMRQMMPFHNERNCPMCADMMHSDTTHAR
ncbi:MAG TPA: hypothetical protein VF681_15855 [Abditibacteriaceae bacterium]|jgi:hypothetical protein